MLRLRCAYSQSAPDIRRRGSSRPSPMCGGSSAGSQSRVEPTYVRFNISQTSTGVTAWSRHGKLCIATQLAQRAGISRMTLSAVEAAEPTPTMGRYLRVMGALGVSGDLVLLASDALEPPAAADPAGQARKELRVSASSAKRELQDLQGLMLPKEAVRRMQKQPALIQRALDTLEEWRQAEDAHSRFLWDEWSVILHRRAWRRALSHTKRSKELRQASPPATKLPPEVRQRILDEVQNLPKGVILGTSSTRQHGSPGSLDEWNARSRSTPSASQRGRKTNGFSQPRCARVKWLRVSRRRARPTSRPPPSTAPGPFQSPVRPSNPCSQTSPSAW